MYQRGKAIPDSTSRSCRCTSIPIKRLHDIMLDIRCITPSMHQPFHNKSRISESLFHERVRIIKRRADYSCVTSARAGGINTAWRTIRSRRRHCRQSLPHGQWVRFLSLHVLRRTKMRSGHQRTTEHRRASSFALPSSLLDLLLHFSER